MILQDRLARVAPALTVVGSVNLDLVAKAARLPRPGETLSDATFTQVPGGKGANQAVAAARLGAQVTLIAAIGADALAEPALAGLRDSGVQLQLVTKSGSTGVALIVVDANGENTIVVAPGTNAQLRPEDVNLPDDQPVLCQLEIPVDTAEWVGDNAPADFFLNAAPARAGAPKADVTIVNRYEYELLDDKTGVVAVTHGSEGAVLYDGGEEVARATPPTVTAVDGTAAGDAFTACLVVSLLENRPRDEALRRACIAGALAASKFGAQSSLPTAQEVDALL
jgi:ribokinase